MNPEFYSLVMILRRAGLFDWGGLYGWQDGCDGHFPSLENEENQ